MSEEPAGRHVGRVTASLVNTFNPTLILIGGVARAGDLLLAATRETAYRPAPDTPGSHQADRSCLGELCR